MIKISFSNEVRKEIIPSVNDVDKRFACLYGMILFSRRLSPEHICFQTESRLSAELFSSLLHSVFRIDADCEKKMHKDGAVMYSFNIRGERSGEIFRTYRLSASERAIDPELIATSSLGVFTAGVFFACGSVNDPAKEYHLEFAVPEKTLADDLKTLLGDIGVAAKTAIRRGQYIVYIKGSESIEDTLTFIGAQQCTLELMNVKIYKDVRNKANRIANCDAANIDKVVNAAMKQTDDIRYIAETEGLDNLTSELREVAEIRLENPGMSLKEIGESLSEPLSRSGVNHRFQKLSAIAARIRNERCADESK